MKDIFAKYAPLVAEARLLLSNNRQNPFNVVIEEAISPTRAFIKGKETLLFGTNNYLGLSHSDAAKKAAIEVIKKHGVGTTGSRIANGTLSIHQELETTFAEAFGKKHAIVFSGGYLANLGVISGIADKNDIILLDADSHASIYDGARLSGAQVLRFRHNKPEDLERRLKLLKDHQGSVLIVVEGIYSMTGNMAPLKEFVRIKKEYGAALLVDEAHSFGVYGDNGLGIAELQGVLDDVDFVVGTFSKAIGTMGGFCISDREELELVRVTSRPYMFTVSPSPEIIGATLANLKEIQSHPEWRENIQRNAKQLNIGLREMGFSPNKDIAAIIGVPVGETPRAMLFWEKLLKKGVYVNLSLPPATPDNNGLLRMSVTSSHTSEEISQALKSIKEVKEEMEAFDI
ncbi:aminotransferase class I/II-fold pyridoxal phosphate-dependent enzyme [Acetobacteraceae bacterium]|nr:aminotransferase class I/II-fold pyridoxal phosphate-dependent enzyme [Acetobacteraceae bacterium]